MEAKAKKVFQERGDSLRRPTLLLNRGRRGPSVFLGFSPFCVPVTLAGGAYWGAGGQRRRGLEETLLLQDKQSRAKQRASGWTAQG